MGAHDPAGGEPSGDDRDDDLNEFTDVIEVLRMGPADLDESPTPSVWAGIEAALISESSGVASPAPEPSSADSPGVAAPAVVHSLDEARAKRAWGKPAAIMTAVAAAVALIGVPIGLSLRSADEPVVELAADLGALAGFGGEGRAEVADASLILDVDGLTPRDGEFYELWLLRIDGEDIQTLSLGQISDDGTIQLPADVDLSEYNIVDISVEIDDGDDDHSGNSILRGELTDDL